MNDPKSSRFRRMALIILILLLITALSVLLVLYITVKRNQKEISLPRNSVSSPPPPTKPTKPTNGRVCTSKQCLRAAGDLAVSMDKSVEPCDDFYQYVCGNWPNAHRQLVNDISNNWMIEKWLKVNALVRDTLTKNTRTGQPKPVEQAKDFYAACMDTGTIKQNSLSTVFDVLDSVNLPRFPTILNVSDSDEVSSHNFDWLDTVIKIKTQLDMHILMGFDVIPLNTSENILLGVHGTTDIFPRSYEKIPKVWDYYRHSRLPLLDEESIQKRLIKNTIKDKEQNLKKNVDENQELLNSEEYKLLKKYVMASDLSMEINGTMLHQNIIRSLEQYSEFVDEIQWLYQEKNNHGYYNVDDLQSCTDGIFKYSNITPQSICKRYLEGMFNVSNVNFDFEKDKVLVDQYFMSCAVCYAALASPDVVELYIWMKVVSALESHITPENRLRSGYCSMVTNELLGMAVSYAIFEPDIFNVTKPKVLNMISEIKNSLRESISKAEWMDDMTKEVSYEKVQKINSLVGIPQWFYEPGKLEEYYEGVETNRDMYLQNMVNIVQARLRKHLNKFRDQNYFLWSFDPSQVNAGYCFRQNSITIPMVMLQHPFFNLGLDSLNYGNLGVTLGHEITHGFDNKGRHIDMNGNEVQWWSDDSIKNYLNLTKCFKYQYSSYYVAAINDYVDGSQTLDENIADNGGLNLALAALKRHLQENGPEEKLPGFEHMSSEQMFFLSFAHTYCGATTEKFLDIVVHHDPHSPQEFRIHGTLLNSEEFAKAWQCPLGSRMNPSRKRCTIF